MKIEEFIQKLFLLLVERGLTSSEIEDVMPSYLDVYDRIVCRDILEAEPQVTEVELSKCDKENLSSLCYDNPVKRYVELCFQLFRPRKNKKDIMEELCNADFLEEKADPYFCESDGKMKAKGQWRWNRLRLLEYYQGLNLTRGRELLEMAIAKVKKENLN